MIQNQPHLFDRHAGHLPCHDHPEGIIDSDHPLVKQAVMKGIRT